MVEQKDYVSYSVLINGIEVNAVYSRDSIDGIFRPLLRRLTRMQKDKNRRILAFFAAPPGAGKSTLLSFLERLASEDEQSGEIQIIGMDGFHRRQAYLVSHTVIRDGADLGRPAGDRWEGGSKVDVTKSIRTWSWKESI